MDAALAEKLAQVATDAERQRCLDIARGLSWSAAVRDWTRHTHLRSRSRT